MMKYLPTRIFDYLKLSIRSTWESHSGRYLSGAWRGKGSGVTGAKGKDGQTDGPGQTSKRKSRPG